MSNKPALIITAVVALLAVAATVFTVTLLRSGNDGTQETGSDTDVNGYEEFVPDDEFAKEVQTEAERLVQDNFKVFELFYLISYDKDSHFEPEPFDNPSEDGYRTLKDGIIEYNTLDELYSLVDVTYIQATADIIKNFSSQTLDGSPVYKDRFGELGVNETYSPKTYDLIWNDVEIELTFVSETETILDAILTTIDDNSEDSEPEVIRTVRQSLMVKGDDGIWRLESIFF